MRVPRYWAREYVKTKTADGQPTEVGCWGWSESSLDEAGRRIDTEYLDGPFKYLKSHWIFHPNDTGCEVEFFVDFEFKSAILQKVIGLVFNEAMHRIVAAFEKRAEQLYGTQRPVG